MGWRRVVHKLTGKCMGRSWTLSKAEMRIELVTDCDGEALVHVEMYRFGELVEELSGDHGQNVAKIHDWIENHAP